MIKFRFYWSAMDRGIELKVQNSQLRICRKTSSKGSAELVKIHTTQPMELVCMDYLSLEPSNRGHLASWWLRTISLDSHISLSISQSNGKNHCQDTLWERYCPLRSSRAIAQRRQEPRVRGFQRAVQYSQHWMHRDNTLPPTRKWDDRAFQPNTLEHARHDGGWTEGRLEVVSGLQRHPPQKKKKKKKKKKNGFASHYLMFGRVSRLAVDAFLGIKTHSESAKHSSTYVSKLKSRLQFAG